MSSLDADSASVPTPSDSDLDPAESADAGRPARRPAAAWIRAVTLAAGLAAGFGAWLLAEPIYGRFQPVLDTANSFMSPTVTDANALKIRRATILEASLTGATLGAVLGLALGLAGGLSRGSVGGGLAAGAFGLVLGAIGGFAAARLLTPLQARLTTGIGDDLAGALLIQGGVSAIIGAAAGAAFSLGLGDGGRRVDLRFITGGLLGAVVGLVVYQMAGAVAFPLDGTTSPLSETWPTRLLAKAAVAVFAALGVALSLAPESKTL